MSNGSKTPPGLPADDAHPVLRKRDYDEKLKPAQYRMREVALAYHQQGLRGVVVVEGADTAGKGGAIRRLTAELDPRFFHVWPIGPPTPQEREEHYLQRFWRRVPPAGQIAIFDRSWYGRVLVERVAELIPEARWRQAYGEINAFEQALAADGVRIAKFYLHVTPAEQKKRLVERATTRHKWWKISEPDIRSYMAHATYWDATAEMLTETSTDAAPWHVIAADDKRHARMEMLTKVTRCFSAGIDTAPLPLPTDVQLLARDVLGVNGNNGESGSGQSQR